MKGSSLILIFVLFYNTFSNGDECNIFLNKFGLVDSGTIFGPTSLAYTADAICKEGTADIEVTLRYYDPLYNDSLYFGLTQEENPNAKCLELKIWRFNFSNYSGPVEVKDLPILASSNLKKKQRTLRFTIFGQELSESTIKTVNSNQFQFTGFYAIAYYAVGTSQAYYTFYFQFTLTLDRHTAQFFSIFLVPFNQYETFACNPTKPCYPIQSTKIQWCTDVTCTTNTIPSLYFNDLFYIQQEVTTTGLTDDYLINTIVFYIGNGLSKRAIPVIIDNSVPGKVLLLLIADIVWSNVTIHVTSYLSTTLLTERRFLEETTNIYDPVSGQSEILKCIKISESVTCGTCDEQCNANDGIAYDSCFQCEYDQSKILVAAFLILILLLF